MYAGVFAVVFGLAKAHAAFVGHYDLTGTSRFAWSAAYAGLLCLTAYGAGLPDLPRTRWSMVSASVLAAAMGAAAMSAVQLVVGDALLPRFVVIGAAVLLPDWFRVCTRLASGGRTRAEARDRVVFVGTVEEARTLDLELHGDPERPAVVALDVTADEVAPTVAAPQPLVTGCRRAGATVLVLDADAAARPDLIAQAAVLHAAGTRVRTLAGFYEEWLGKLPVAELERSSLLFDVGELHRSRYGRVKRLVDLAAALAGVLVLAVLLPFVLVGNRFANRGPLLYRQERVGKGGRRFTILKLRTMTPTVDGGAGEWTAEDDPRVTRFGRFLRRSHLDELPQVVNVLRGDLSIVGPRPEQPRYVDELREKLPFYEVRHVVRPGLTGWAQVKYGYAGSEADALEKLQYEFWYLRHQSLATDLRILGRTIRSVIGSRGQGR